MYIHKNDKWQCFSRHQAISCQSAHSPLSVRFMTTCSASITEVATRDRAITDGKLSCHHISAITRMRSPLALLHIILLRIAIGSMTHSTHSTHSQSIYYYWITRGDQLGSKARQAPSTAGRTAGTKLLTTTTPLVHVCSTAIAMLTNERHNLQ